MPVSDLILDFDGTLIDSGPAILATLGAALSAHNIEPVRPLTRDLIGPPLHATMQTLTGISDQVQLEVLASEFRSRYDTDGWLATEAYPGVHEALQARVASGGRLHLATNKRERPTLLLLEHFGWRGLFTSVYCLDSRTPAYPSKGEMLKRQLVDMGLSAAACIYVGDTHHDEVAAGQAGIPFIAVGWGYGTGVQAVTKGARMLAMPQDLVRL